MMVLFVLLKEIFLLGDVDACGLLCIIILLKIV